jgi:hypothetical protein
MEKIPVFIPAFVLSITCRKNARSPMFLAPENSADMIFDIQ